MVRLTKTRRMRWAGNVARIRKDRRVACRVLVGNSEGYPGVDKRVMLQLIFKEED
jgi:hypothetical protein